MNQKITAPQIIARLEENDLAYGVLNLSNGVSLIITQRGGRMLGPFLSPDSESMFWVNNALADSAAFREFLDRDDWNLGGDRIWIAPEIQYNIRDRSNFWGSYTLPPQVDPGRYKLSQPESEGWLLTQDMTLEAFNIATGQKTLHLEKLIRPAEDPLRKLSNYSDLIDGVIFSGYEQTITLAENKQDGIMSEAWNIIQLHAGGWLLIPATPGAEYTDYYEPVDEDVCARYPNHIRLKITGDRQYKIGMKAAHVFGRLGYFNHLADGQAYLVVRNFFNNPSVPYAEEPDHLPGGQGHSIHVYNDGGQFGGFGELEVNTQTIGGETGRFSGTDQLLLWLYVGPVDRIKRIGLNLLGIEI